MPFTSNDKVCELLIDGTLYDVSEFAARHPGGSIIRYGLGTDATSAFNEFHARSAKARKVLALLPSRPAPAATMAATGAQSAVLDDFRALRAELVREGFFEPSYVHCALRLLELAAMQGVGAYTMLHTPWVYSGAALFGLGTGRAGWVMHEAGHSSFTCNLRVDRFIQQIVNGLGSGLSAARWNNGHNRHHATPQKLRHDVDLDTMPLIAFHRGVIQKPPSGLQRAWLSAQHALFAPVSTMAITLGWLVLHPISVWRHRQFGDGFWMALRWALFFYLTSSGATWGMLLFAYWIGSMYMITQFSLSHTHMPAVAADQHVSWVEYSACHTANVAPAGGLVSWWMGWLNFQIEHHLFPSMPQFRQAQVSARVRALLERHGYTYYQYGYFEACGRVWRNLFEAGNDRESTLYATAAGSQSGK